MGANLTVTQPPTNSSCATSARRCLAVCPAAGLACGRLAHAVPACSCSESTATFLCLRSKSLPALPIAVDEECAERSGTSWADLIDSGCARGSKSFPRCTPGVPGATAPV